MRNRSTRALIALNAALVCALAVVTLAPAAEAQRGGRGRGEYTMVSGRMQGTPEAAIYIIDANNLELVAVKWNRSRKQLDGVGFRDLAADQQGQTNRGVR